jgi:Ca-activated chloride channel family protein
VFEFGWPWLAVLLPLPWVARRLLPPRTVAVDASQGSAELLYPSASRLTESFTRFAPGWDLPSAVQTGLAALAWVAVVAALMRPQWLESRQEVVSPGYDLMLAVDASRSMEALDFTLEGRRVNRMAVVKGVVGRFIEQRHGDRVGLIVFGDGAYLQAPLTVDGAAVRAMLEEVVPRMAGDATAIGDAIGLAVKKLRERPEGSRVLVLLTDGENTAGSLPPIEAARLARKYGVRIYAVGVGSKGKVPFPGPGGRITMEDMQIDEALLADMAAVTGGAFYMATDTQALEAIYRRIDALEKTRAETRTTRVPQPLYRWPLAVALAGLLALGWLVARRGGRMLG